MWYKEQHNIGEFKISGFPYILLLPKTAPDADYKTTEILFLYGNTGTIMISTIEKKEVQMKDFVSEEKTNVEKLLKVHLTFSFRPTFFHLPKASVLSLSVNHTNFYVDTFHWSISKFCKRLFSWSFFCFFSVSLTVF